MVINDLLEKMVMNEKYDGKKIIKEKFCLIVGKLNVVLFMDENLENCFVFLCDIGE